LGDLTLDSPFLDLASDGIDAPGVGPREVHATSGPGRAVLQREEAIEVVQPGQMLDSGFVTPEAIEWCVALAREPRARHDNRAQEMVVDRHRPTTIRRAGRDDAGPAKCINEAAAIG